MTDQELEQMAIEFIGDWESFQRELRWNPVPFETRKMCRKLIAMELIADHVNPHRGEYAIQYAHAGVAFFTGSGELVFTKKGLWLAKKIADMTQKRAGDMQVIKVEHRARG